MGTRTETTGAARYHALMFTLNDEVARLRTYSDPATPKDVEEAVAKVERWRSDHQQRIVAQWENVTRALNRAHAHVPSAEEFGQVPVPSTAPTAEELQAALDFGPAVTKVQSLLPRRVTFDGFSPLLRAMNRNAIIAVVICAMIGIAADDPWSNISEGMRMPGVLALLVCLVFAFIGWSKHIKSVARAQRWPFMDARYQGAVYLAILMPSLGSVMSFSLFG